EWYFFNIVQAQSELMPKPMISLSKNPLETIIYITTLWFYHFVAVVILPVLDKFVLWFDT
ncbi:hypothetical protein, partial [Photobacterium sanguinicancri]|uniref:hypothetical protein n=1 Tax=Photobacterium sanguinicancri TaxID=875932 RepID=UPI000A5A050A